MDMNGDLKIDLFGVTSQASSVPFKVWRNVWNSSDPQSDIFSMYVIWRCLARVVMRPIIYPVQCRPKFQRRAMYIGEPSQQRGS